MRLTLSRLRVKSATQVILAACMLVGITSLAIADLEDKLADMTPKEAFDYGVELFDADNKGEAAKVFTYIYEVHNNHELAPWALFRLAQIATRAAYESGDYSQAIAYTQKIIDEYPNSNLVTRGYIAANLTGLYLVNLKDYQAAVDNATWFLDNYSDMMADEYQTTTITLMAQAYVGMEDYAAAEEALTSRLPTCPFLLRYQDYYETVVQIQIATKDFDALLSTARAAYALCDFNEEAIKAMANLVRRAFIARGEFSKGIQFLAAQEDAGKPNPLRDVPMPTVTEEQKEQLVQGAGEGSVNRILVDLYIGDNSHAFEEAIGYMSSASTEEAIASLMEVARVFKAVDLNVVRANEFINYAKTGEGKNPLLDVEF